MTINTPQPPVRKMSLIERHLNPVNQQRLQRFRKIRRAYWSFWILFALFVICLPMEFISNDTPLLVRFNDRTYFPLLKFYTANEFSNNGIMTRPNYKQLNASPAFSRSSDNYMIFPPIPYGPQENIPHEEIHIPDKVSVKIQQAPRMGYLDLRPDLSVRKAVSCELFFGRSDRDMRSRNLSELWKDLPDEIASGLNYRFNNKSTSALLITTIFDGQQVKVTMPEYVARIRARKKIRINFQTMTSGNNNIELIFAQDLTISGKDRPRWNDLPVNIREQITKLIIQRFDTVVPPVELMINGCNHVITLTRQEVSFPFQPCSGHWLGLDEAGRDVAVQIIYAFRINILFGILLVIISKIIGVCVGAVQGYYGGWLDISCQRLTEIWGALPFLYIMILISSLYGRSFGILLMIYCMFNWIGISYYMRAEFLRLRRQPFVESARIQGLPARKIIFGHILPNALVPLITFVPFSLVGAIGTLSALDFLGFGLPPLTPSWGGLLEQAQNYSFAWWLTLFPALALFITMLLGVFIGEGVRAAFDPKKFSRME